MNKIGRAKGAHRGVEKLFEQYLSGEPFVDVFNSSRVCIKDSDVRKYDSDDNFVLNGTFYEINGNEKKKI